LYIPLTGRLATSCGGGVNVGVDGAESILLRLMLWKTASGAQGRTVRHDAATEVGTVVRLTESAPGFDGEVPAGCVRRKLNGQACSKRDQIWILARGRSTIRTVSILATPLFVHQSDPVSWFGPQIFTECFQISVFGQCGDLTPLMQRLLSTALSMSTTPQVNED
jgi:hypothetical protein